jgi:hypothetical protein
MKNSITQFEDMTSFTSCNIRKTFEVSFITLLNLDISQNTFVFKKDPR